MQPWKTLNRSLLLDHSKYLRVENHTVQLPDGRTISDWAWLIMPDYVNIVVVTEEGKFLCFRQPKYGAGGITLALAGGYLEPGEDPLAAAQRELLEVCTVVTGRFYAPGSQVLGDVHGGNVETPGWSVTAFEFVGRDEFEMFTKLAS